MINVNFYRLPYVETVSRNISMSTIKQDFFYCPSLNNKGDPCDYVGRDFSLSRAMWNFKRHYTEGKRYQCCLSPDMSKFPWYCVSCKTNCDTASDLKNHLVEEHCYYNR